VAPLDSIWQEAFGRNGGSLWDDARDKVRQGLTTVEEVVWALTDYRARATAYTQCSGRTVCWN